MEYRNEHRIQLDSGTIEVCEGNYLKMVLSDHITMTVAELMKREAVILDLCNGKRMPFLIDTTDKFINYDIEAKEYISNNSQIGHLRQAEAFITNNVGLQLMLKNYIRLNPNKCPAKIFGTEAAAMEWIVQFFITE